MDDDNVADRTSAYRTQYFAPGKHAGMPDIPDNYSATEPYLPPTEYFPLDRFVCKAHTLYKNRRKRIFYMNLVIDFFANKVKSPSKDF